MQSEMHTRLSSMKGWFSSPEHRSRGWFRSVSRTIIAGLVSMVGVAGAIEVPVEAAIGPTNAVQAAIDKCPDNDPTGCVVKLKGASYTLSNSILIRNKSNITIMSANAGRRSELSFYDDGTKAGPDSDPDSLALKPAGWKKWPTSCGTAVGGSKNTSNPFSTSGIQRNGVILIQGSHNIVIDGITVNGVKPLGVGKDGIWDCNYGVWYGNFGINLYLSGKITIRNSEIKNCFAGIYNFNRNKGGPMAVNNQSDLDKEQLVPNSRYGEMGGHLIEGNLIHDNIWGAFLESNWDLGSTWRFNRIYNCHNTATTFATFTISEAKNHTGGFMYLKDAVGTPERVYHNTFWKVSAIFGQGGWRGNINNYFYNNLVADPWINYTSDSAGYLNNNFIEPYKSQNNMIWKSTQFMFANTFVPLKSNSNGTGRSWGDTTRLQFQIQGGSHTGNIKYLDGIQYQGQARGTIPQEWALEEFDYKSINSSKIAHSVATTNGPATFNALDTAKVRAIIGGILDENGVKIPIKDTLGLIAASGTTNMLPKNNHVLKSVQFQSTDSSKATFLTPVWTNTGVDSTILGRTMQFDASGNSVAGGGYSFLSNTTGKSLARGAMQPDGSLGVGMLTIGDDQPVVLTGTTAVLSFGLSSNVGAVSNLKVLQACLYPDVNLADDGATQNLGTCQKISTAGFTPALGGNSVALDFVSDPGFNSRFELIIGGTTATGEQILSNVGIWMIHKAEQQFAVTFHKEKTDASRTDTTFAGDLIWMKLQPVKITGVTKPLNPAKIVNRPGAYEWKYDAQGKIVQRLDTVWIDKATKKFRLATILIVDSTKPIKDTIRSYVDLDTLLDNTSKISNVSINTQGMLDLAGEPVTASKPLIPTMQGPTWVQVRFTKAMVGLGVVATGQDATKAVYQGSGTITVRPGPAYVAELRDPASYRFVRDSGFTTIPFQTKYPAKIEVKDIYGNVVDVPTDVSLSVVAASQNAYVGGGSDTKTVVTIPATGVGTAPIQATGALAPEPFNSFWLYSWIGSAATPKAGTIQDTAKVLVKQPDMILDWDIDSIRGIVKDTFRVTLSLLNSDLKPFAGTDFYAHLNSRFGKLKFYLPTDVAKANPLDSVDLKATGTVTLIVTSDVEALDDSIYAFNTDVNNGEAAVIAPVNFKKPPEPPYPVVDSAAYLDTDCDGKADLLRVWLKGSETSVADLDTSKTPIHGMSLTVGAKAIAYDSTEWKFATGRKDLLEFAVKDVADLANIPGKDLLLQYTMRRPPLTDTVVDAGLPVSVKDRVAPRVDTAVVIENYSSPYDVFMVRFTEPVSFSGQSWPFVVKGATLANTSGIVVDSFFADPAKSLGANTYRVVIHNNRDAQFKPLVIQYADSLKIDPAGVLTDGSKNHGAECAPLVALTKMVVLPSFTGKITTNHPQGRANVVAITFSRPLLTLERIDSLEVRFNGYTQTVATTASNWSSTDNTTWTLTMSDLEAFRYGVTRGSSDDKFGALVTAYGRNLNPPVSNYLPSSGLVADSVPAVLVNFTDASGKPYAQLTFGDGVDSIRIKLSEPVASVPGTIGLANAATSQDVGTKGIIQGGDDQTWIVVQDTLNTNRVNAGDTVALGNRFQGLDALLPTQGANVSKAVVIGGDRGPVAAFYSDSNGVGTASQLTLTFAKPLTHEAIFRLMWPGKDGGMQSINVTTTGAIGKMILSLDLSGKFPEGVTGADIKDLGVMTSILTGSDTEFVTSEFPPHVRFAIADSVAPIIDSARMIYGAYEGDASSMYDTLRLYFSESVKVNGADINKAISKLVGTSDVALTPKLPTFVLAADGKSGFMLFDTTTGLILPEKGDSIRLIAGGEGGILSDAGGAMAGTKAKRTIVLAGLRKAIEPSLNIILPNPNGEVRTEREQIVLKPVETKSPLEGVGSNLAILIGNGESSNSVFTVVSKGTGQSSISWSELNGTIGIDIPVNTGTIKEKSLITVVLYDKYGIFVGNAEAVLRQSDFNSSNTNKSGKSSIKILWDGRSAKKQIVTSGVYTARILFYREEVMPDNTIQRVMLYNKLKNIGVAR